MTPPTLKHSTHNHTHPTMSPTHSAISGVVTCNCGRNDSTTSSNPLSTSSMIPRTVHFGKYHIPIYLPKIQPVSYTAWRKKTRFYQLASTIYGLLKSHSITNLIPILPREFPI